MTHMTSVASLMTMDQKSTSRCIYTVTVPNSV